MHAECVCVLHASTLVDHKLYICFFHSYLPCLPGINKVISFSLKITTKSNLLSVGQICKTLLWGHAPRPPQMEHAECSSHTSCIYQLSHFLAIYVNVLIAPSPLLKSQIRPWFPSLESTVCENTLQLTIKAPNSLFGIDQQPVSFQGSARQGAR